MFFNLFFLLIILCSRFNGNSRNSSYTSIAPSLTLFDDGAGADGVDGDCRLDSVGPCDCAASDSAG